MSLQLGWAAEVRLELDDAVQRAWESHADALVQAARVDAAAASVNPARAPADPQFRGRMENVGSRTDVPQWTLRLRQDVEPIGAIRARARAAQAEADVEIADLEAIRSAVRDEVAAVFDASRVLGVAESRVLEEQGACDSWLEVVEKRRAAGVGTAEDVLEARMARLSATRRLVGVQADLARSRAVLTALVGGEPGDTVVPEGPDLEVWVLEEVADGGAAPEVARARARLVEQEAERRSVAAERVPFLDFVEAQVVLETGSPPAVGVAVAASLPMFSLTDGAVRAADAEVAARRTAVDAAERAGQSRRAAARAALEASIDAVRTLSAGIDALAAGLEAERESLPPHRYWELAADLARERQELVERLHDAVMARRAVERGIQ